MAFSTPPASSRSRDFEQQLFESARDDSVPEGSRRNVARALGFAVGAPVGEASELPRVEGTVASAGAPAAGVAARASIELSLFGKSALVAIAGGAVALAVALLPGKAPSAATTTAARIAASASVPPAAVAPQQRVASGLASGSPEGNPPVEVIAREPEPLQHEPAPGAAPSKRRARLSAPRVSKPAASLPVADTRGSRLLDEVRQLDSARNALSAGHPSQALNELDRYELEFPNGTLALDAALLEVRALDRSGQRTAAHRQARQLLSRPGAERHRAELEAIVNPLASGSQTRRRDIEEAR
jgi:hypothetical protein